MNSADLYTTISELSSKKLKLPIRKFQGQNIISHIIWVEPLRLGPYRYSLLQYRVLILDGSRYSGVHHVQGLTMMIGESRT